MCGHNPRQTACVRSRFSALASPTLIGILWAAGCGSGGESGVIGSHTPPTLGAGIVADDIATETDETELFDPAGVTDVSPSLTFSAVPVFCCNPLSIEFAAGLSGESSAPASAFIWDFGDGTTASGQAVRHTYAWPGEYKVVVATRLADGTELVHQRDLSLRIDGSGLDGTLTVNAGRDQVVFGGDRVVLAGEIRNAGVDADIAWRQTSGPLVILEGASTLTAGFGAPAYEDDSSWILVFELTVTSGEGVASDEVRVTVRASSDLGTANAPPIVVDQSISLRQDDSAALILSGSSPDGGELTFTVLAGPTHGALSTVVRAGPESAAVTYTPYAGFVGSDSFTFRASDGTTISNTATFTIDVEAMPERTRGISVTFVKWQELETRDGEDRQPLPLEVAGRNLSKYEAIWSANYIPSMNLPAWKWLRQQPTLALHYTSSVATEEGVSGLLDYEYISTHHPEWILDTRHSSFPDSSLYNRFYLDVCDPGFQEWAAGHVLERATGEWQRLTLPFDGVAFDNVAIGQKSMSVITNRDPDWAYADRWDEWNACFSEYLKVVKQTLNEHGFMLVVNHSLEYGADTDAEMWDLLLGSVDGILTERAIHYDDEIYADEAWLMSIERHEQILDRGLIDWWVAYPPEAQPERQELFLYDYCSWLLVKRADKSFFYAGIGDPSYRNPIVPWYEEYDSPIGEPTSSRYRRGACWMRDYANALIVVNPTREIQSIEIEGATLQMPPMSGRILSPR